MDTAYEKLEQSADDFLFRRIALCVFLITAAYVPFFFFLNLKFPASALLLGALTLSPLSYFLDRKGYRDSARILFILACNYYVFSTSLGLGHNAGSEFYCLPSMVLGFLLFDLNRKGPVICSVAIALITWALINTNTNFSVPANWLAENPPALWLKRINFVGAFVILTLFQTIFVKSSIGVRDQEIQKLNEAQNLAAIALKEKSESEMKFKIVLESMSEGLIVHDSSGKIFQFNQAAALILGLTENELAFRNCLDMNWRTIRKDGSVFPNDEFPGAVALKTWKPVPNVTMGLKQPSGELRWIQVSAVPLRISEGAETTDESGGDIRVILTFSDITSMVKANSDIQHIFNHSEDLLCIAGMDGFFKRISPSFQRVLGFTEEEIMSTSFINFYHPDDMEETLKQLEKLSQGHSLLHFETRFLTKSGKYRLITWVCQPDIETGLLYATGRDVTELRLSEAKNNQILKAIESAALVAYTDAAGVISKVNANFSQASGFAEEELIGKNHREIYNGATIQDFRRMHKALRKSKIWMGDIESRTKSGAPIHARTVVAPIRNVDDRIEEFVSISFDVTAQKTFERQLVAAQSIAKVGSWHFNLKTYHQTWSSEHYKIFEITEPQSQSELHRLYRERIHPDDLRELDLILARARMHNEEFIFNHRVVLDDGARIKYVQGIGTITRDHKGVPLYASGTCRDRTAEVEMENSLQSERLKSIHASKLASLGELSAGIAHEINNPLAVIAGNIPLLEKFKNNPEKFAIKSEAITRATDRIARIVNGLRKFSRSSDKSERNPHSLAILLNEALTITEVKLNRHTVPIEINIQSEATLYCDAVEIEQVLVNLINNAIDAIKDRDEKWIRINAFDDDSFMTIQLIDSGTGISNEIEAKLFQPFFTTKAVGEGTGLGLSISKGILNQHKATLTLNRFNPNTCFEIRFPIRGAVKYAV